MSRQPVLVRKSESRRSRDALLAAEFVALLGLEVAGATPFGRLVRKPLKLVMKRTKAAEAHMDELEGLKGRAGDLLKVLLRAVDDDSFEELMDPIIWRLAEFMEDASQVLKWKQVRRFVREPDLDRIVRRAGITLKNLERLYDVSNEQLKVKMMRKLCEHQERMQKAFDVMFDM